MCAKFVNRRHRGIVVFAKFVVICSKFAKKFENLFCISSNYSNEQITKIM